MGNHEGWRNHILIKDFPDTLDPDMDRVACWMSDRLHGRGDAGRSVTIDSARVLHSFLVLASLGSGDQDNTSQRRSSDRESTRGSLGGPIPCS